MITRTLLVAAVLAAPAVAAADTQRWAGDGFVVTATSADGGAAGAPIAVTVSIATAGAYKVNAEYPTALELTAPADVAIARAKLGRADASVRHDRAAFTVTVTPRTVGAKRIGFKLKFALCTDTTCEPRKQLGELRVTAK